MITCNLPSYSNTLHVSRPWRPDSANVREEIWFDEIHRFLYIDVRKSRGTCLRISDWPHGLVISRWNDVRQIWQNEEWDPGIPIPTENWKPVCNGALEEFFQEIPSEILNAISPFKWRQFILLKMIRICPEMLELLQSNPMLAWLLADAITERQIPLSEAKQWIFRKRKDILQFVGGTGSESGVRVLSKIKMVLDSTTESPGDERSHLNLIELKKLIRNDQLMLALRSIKIIPLPEVADLNTYPDLPLWLLTWRINADEFYCSTPPENGKAVVRDLWDDTLSLGERLAIKDRLSRLKKCDSISSLRNLHDTWSREYTTEKRTAMLRNLTASYGTNKFPLPLAPGCDGIVPITTIEELFAEGEEMHNCVASYAEKIMDGNSSIYKVLAPERATLEIASENNRLLNLQLKTFCNGEPTEATSLFVEKWLAKQNLF